MPRRHAVATLWNLGWNGDHLSCAVYRAGTGLEMRLESGRQTILSEPFEIRPKMLARVRALKQSLERKGWQDLGR